jgi:TonB family protein
MTAQRWTSDLHAVDQVLRSYSWADGLASDGAVLQSMQDHMEGGEGAARLLAMAELLKAVAEEGLGKSEEALWDWQTAWNLSPEIGGVNLGVYGSAGTRLRERIAPELAQAAAAAPGAPPGESPWARAHQRQDIQIIEALKERGAKITKPEKIAAPPPKYPLGARHGCLNGNVVIESILDTRGMVTHFHVLQSVSPLLDLAALQALQQWRFDPARLDGKPVKVYYTLTVNFATRNCVPRG